MTTRNPFLSPFSPLRSSTLRAPEAPQPRNSLGSVAWIVVIGFVLVLVGVVGSGVKKSAYVGSGDAVKDALAYGCPSGEAERAICRTCASDHGVCCDLRCPASTPVDLRLRCEPGSGCVLAPASEVRVINYGNHSETSTLSQ